MPRSKSISVPTTSNVRTLKSRKAMGRAPWKVATGNESGGRDFRSRKAADREHVERRRRRAGGDQLRHALADAEADREALAVEAGRVDQTRHARARTDERLAVADIALDAAPR